MGFISELINRKSVILTEVKTGTGDGDTPPEPSIFSKSQNSVFLSVTTSIDISGSAEVADHAVEGPVEDFSDHVIAKPETLGITAIITKQLMFKGFALDIELAFSGKDFDSKIRQLREWRKNGTLLYFLGYGHEKMESVIMTNLSLSLANTGTWMDARTVRMDFKKIRIVSSDVVSEKISDVGPGTKKQTQLKTSNTPRGKVQAGCSATLRKN